MCTNSHCPRSPAFPLPGPLGAFCGISQPALSPCPALPILGPQVSGICYFRCPGLLHPHIPLVPGNCAISFQEYENERHSPTPQPLRGFLLLSVPLYNNTPPQPGQASTSFSHTLPSAPPQPWVPTPPLKPSAKVTSSSHLATSSVTSQCSADSTPLSSGCHSLSLPHF